MKAIRETAMTTVMIPSSRSKPSHAQMKVDDPRLAPLLAHLDLLLNLGEVCATRVVSTLVDGMQGHANRKGTIAHVYLPILMGYRSCYKPYMLLLGLHTRCAPAGDRPRHSVVRVPLPADAPGGDGGHGGGVG